MIDWLTGRRRNRRFNEREYVLDVKMRTSQARAARLRVLGGVGAFLLAAAGIWYGGKWMLDRLIYKNEAFAIQQIDVQTDGVLNTETVRRWAMVRTGQNLMALDLIRVQRDLEIQPAIQFAAVERVLPHTLRLCISERDPVAQTLVTTRQPGGPVEQVVYDFDEDGYVMRPLDPAWRTAPPPASEHLPILLNVAPNEVPLGHATDSTQIRAALELISEFDHSPMAGMADLKTINVAVPEILQVTTGQGSQIVFSLNQFDTQLRRWRMIYDQYQKWGRAITWLDLSIANNLPVRSVALNGALPLPAPLPAKPFKTRKKHV